MKGGGTVLLWLSGRVEVSAMWGTFVVLVVRSVFGLVRLVMIRLGVTWFSVLGFRWIKLCAVVVAVCSAWTSFVLCRLGLWALRSIKFICLCVVSGPSFLLFSTW